MRIDTVIDAGTQRQRLERLRDLSTALGLSGSDPKRAVLVIEKPPAFTLEMATTRLTLLNREYPNWKTDFLRAGLPEVFLREMDRAVLTNYEFLLKLARDVVLSRLQNAGNGNDETTERWSKVRDWLQRDPEELAAWRVLALVLLRLREPHAPDLVTELAGFLGETEFTLDARRITLEIPDNLRIKAPSSAALTVSHSRPKQKETTIVYEQNGEPIHSDEARMTTYRFERRKGDKLVYLRGDDLSATLPLRDNMQLTWSRNRSTLYQFERLSCAPWLHKSGEDADKGEIADGVRVIFSPLEGWPRVPDLLPPVRLSR
jgi:hypothetical protein